MKSTRIHHVVVGIQEIKSKYDPYVETYSISHEVD